MYEVRVVDPILSKRRFLGGDLTCFNSPKDPDGNSDFDADNAEDFFKSVFSDLQTDQEENEDIFTFFKRNIPPAASLVTLRATAFKVAADLLTDDNESNVALFRCVNVVVHAFENVCLV